jgi:hypothetical protein
MQFPIVSGQEMKKIIVAMLFITILAAVSLCGCSILTGGQATPAPTVYGPIPSALPTPTPTPEPDSVVANSKPSGDVKIITAGEDWKVITDQKTRDGMQFENISLAIVNDGSQPAKKIVLAVTIVDEIKGINILDQQFEVGDLPRGGQRMINLVTDPHDPSNYILLTIKIHWGDHGEYYSETPLKMTKSFML